ncbi:MAG: chaperonin GroEL [Planctomycetota bacterium]|nr:chaperonin GroEL [Planctomycetota bacterium]
MAKQMLFDHEARSAIKRGIEKVGQSVRHTLGPRGRSIVIDKSWGAPNVTDDGSTVADEIELVDPYENIGAQMIKEAASKTSDTAGDGTTTACVLAEAIFIEGVKRVTTGVGGIALARGISKCVEQVVEHLKKISRPAKGRKEIEQVATVSSKSDPLVGKSLADAIDKVGHDGAITIEEGKGIETEIEVVEGMQFDRGYLTPHFVTDQESVTCVLEEPYILIHEDKLSSVNKLIPLLETVSSLKKPLLVIAEDIEGEALATLVVNKIRGILQVCAVKAPGYGDRRRAMLEDIAIMTNAKPIFKDLGIDLEKVGVEYLGRAKRVVVDSENTTITEGAGSTAKIKERVAQIRKEMEDTDSDYDREKLQERLSKLSGGVAQINVGAATEVEMKGRKARFDDALHAVRAALEEGIVPGGGVALLRAAGVLDSVKLTGDAAFAKDVVRKALEAPIRLIAANSGVEGSIVARKVSEGKDDFGYDAENAEYGKMFEKGIVDPTKVVRSALLNAASVASALLTADCIIVEEEEEDAGPKAGMGMPPGMGGMGGMSGMGGGMM